jgi:DNA-directed RNA polymerase subunit RPC12/RpoP
MKSLNDFNKERQKIYDNYRTEYPKLNGIACPECESELYDTDDMTLASNPPQKNVRCKNCGFRGYRVK